MRSSMHERKPDAPTGDRRAAKPGGALRENMLSGGKPAGWVGTVASGASAQSSSTIGRPDRAVPAVAAGEGPPLATAACLCALAAALGMEPPGTERLLPGVCPGTSTDSRGGVGWLVGAAGKPCPPPALPPGMPPGAAGPLTAPCLPCSPAAACCLRRRWRR